MVPQPKEIAPGVYWLETFLANVYLVRSGSTWDLIDTGFPNRGQAILYAATSLFGGERPAAILLTHGHPDHSGSALELSRLWSVPVFVHRDELPYVTGTTYPLWVLPMLPKRPDPPVGGFMLPFAAVLLPFHDPRLARWLSGPMERMAAKSSLGDAARGYVPGDGVPGLPDWECIPTPGHTPGHVAFFRRSDRVLITGDACVTVDLDSFWGLLRNEQCIARPPSVATWNWQAAKVSVAALARLEPTVLASGHGVPMSGPRTARELRNFAERFSGRTATAENPADDQAIRAGKGP